MRGRQKSHVGRTRIETDQVFGSTVFRIRLFSALSLGHAVFSRVAVRNPPRGSSEASSSHEFNPAFLSGMHLLLVVLFTFSRSRSASASGTHHAVKPGLKMDGMLYSP